MIWGDHYGNHHNPHVWTQPEDYILERWICKEGDPLYPPKNAWRPFEKGPWNCVGQELALTEIKLILALSGRDSHIFDAYAEFYRTKGNSGNMRVNGQRAYIVRIGESGHPAGGYSCKVRRVHDKENCQ